MNDITALMATMKAAAEKATALNLDTAQEIRDEDGCIECPVCGGEGHVDAERDYCNIDKVALGVQFYGIGEHHGIAEEYFRQVVPANVLALVEALEKAQRANAAQDDHINQQQDSIEKLEKGNQHAAKRINSWRRLAKQSIAEQEKCVNELDAARQRIVELNRKNCELDSLTQRWGVERAENADRIAELESRTVTVKLPKVSDDAFWLSAYGRLVFREETYRSAVINAICDAGIQVAGGEA